MVPAPHVWMVAVPDVVGVHWKTRSGARPEIPHVPASVLVPLVVPVKVPPPAGMTVALPQAAPARVVEVVLEGAAGGVTRRRCALAQQVRQVRGLRPGGGFGGEETDGGLEALIGL